MNLVLRQWSVIVLLLFTALSLLYAVPDSCVYKIYQFPEGKLPFIDGRADDWETVPESYVIGIDSMKEDEGKYFKPDHKTLNIKVKLGWSKESNRLYFLYEAYDNYWSFSREDLSVDIFEVVVDGDRSGGPFISKFYPFKDVTEEESWILFQGRQAQNYHIYTPSKNGDWCMYWGPQDWLKYAPYSDHAYRYDFREGEAGKLMLEFYITPFDYAAPEGPDYSVVSRLWENKLIGIAWAVIDYDNNLGKGKDGFWNLSDEHTMYGNADYLKTFRLMPQE